LSQCGHEDSSDADVCTFGEKLPIFKNLWYVRTDKVEGVELVRIFSDRELIFPEFEPTAVMDGPLGNVKIYDA